MDIETDKLVQQTIRQSFANCTVLTVAHRLYTIIDSTKIMVMDKGKIVEYDSPKELLIKRGNFSRLVDETGEQVGCYLITKFNINVHVGCQISSGCGNGQVRDLRDTDSSVAVSNETCAATQRPQERKDVQEDHQRE